MSTQFKMILTQLILIFLVIISIVLAVEQKPRFHAIQKNVTVVTGNTAILPCTIKSLGSYKIVWMSPAERTLTLVRKRVTEDERISVERPYVNEWNLHVREVTLEDSGVYMCQINTSPVQVRPVQLIVHQPPEILDHLSSLEVIKVREGETVQLVCNVTGFPSPNVTWYRISKGLIEDSDKEKKNIGANGEVLMIHNVSRYCDDDYQCVAFNGVEHADTRTMRVRVQFQPEVQLPNKKIGQVLNGYTILECEVTAFPLSITTWRYKGQDINSMGKKYTTEVYSEGPNKITLTLKIQSLTRQDYGDYECFSENFIGHDSQIMTLYEYRKKTTPKSTTTTTTTTTTPWRRWRNGYDNDDGDDDGDDNDIYDGYSRGDNKRVNQYNTHNNGRESKLQLRPNGHNNRNDEVNNKNEDGSVQSVISDPDSARHPSGPVHLLLLAVFTSVICWMMT